MICQNCKKEIADNSQYCFYCGAKQADVSEGNQSPYRQRPVPSASRRKQVGYVVLSVAILFVILLAASMVINSMVLSNNLQEDQSNLSENSSSTENFTPDPVGSYDEVFSQYGITYSPEVFSGMDSASYAAVDKDTGYVDCLDFGYQGNLILNLRETKYYVLDGYNDLSKEILYYQMVETYEELDSLPFCTVTYEMQEQYYMIRFTFTDLDQPENYEKMIELGIVKEGSLALSMKLADEALLSKGYQKK